MRAMPRGLGGWVVLFVAASCGGRTVDGRNDTGGAGSSSAGSGATGGSSAAAGGSGSAAGGSSAGGFTSNTGGHPATGGSGPTPPPPPRDAGPEPTDPSYPYVEWNGGHGYEEACPSYDGNWGMLCWYFDGTRSDLCYDPANCNACSCSIPCGPNMSSVPECPRGATGNAIPACVMETPNSAGSCLLTCDRGERCPDGMVCMGYPGLFLQVCMWLAR